jgi:hypothetical protein
MTTRDPAPFERTCNGLLLLAVALTVLGVTGIFAQALGWLRSLGL